ncbi:chitin synthase-domain-containing protein [Entophlyctis helioformis]|nr:chitin synthase-domain-containing protein [Entophlyctis helioformis]
MASSYKPVLADNSQDLPLHTMASSFQMQPQGSSAATFSTDTIARYSKKEVNAKAGNFVLNVPVAQEIIHDAVFQQGEEFTHMTYTAVTCDAEDFPKQYDLRQRRFNRHIKIALVVTMYNEDDMLFIKSMLAVQKNIAYLCSPECPYSWGPDGWKNFVVVIVSDGRAKINPRVKTVLSVMGVFADGLMRSSVNDQDVKAHIFEYTAQTAVDRDLSIRSRKQGIYPTQIIFVLKEKNAKKINSHKWFFEAVCETIQPEVTLLLDVGTKPSAVSFYQLYRAFERDPNIGGACGEIAAELGQTYTKLLNPLVATQNFEYKMSNILDKPLESSFGYISVLPGAFSAYRYKALKGRPLEMYFAGEKPGADIFTSNLYLAEDRILCFELVAKKHEAWRLKYVKSARAETDVPDQLPELISQRRRWLNGSFFAALYALSNFFQIFQSPHSAFQKLLFTLEFMYNAVNLGFTWISLANFYLSFYFLCSIAKDVNPKNLPLGPNTDVIFDFVRELYIFAIVAIFISSLSNRPQGSKWLYYSLSVMFSLIMCLMLYLGGYTIYTAVIDFKDRDDSKQTFIEYFRSTTVFRDLVVSVLSTYGLYFVSSVIHLDPWHCITSMVQYLLILPTYVNIFMIYSFCNLHDVSWGTKGDNKAEEVKAAVVQTNAAGQQVFQVEIPTEPEDVTAAWNVHVKQLAFQKANPFTESSKVDEKTKNEDACKEFRTKVVLSWIVSNAVIVVLFTNDKFLKKYFSNSTKANAVNPYLTFVFWSVAVLSLIRFIGCCVYMVQWWIEKIAEAASAPARPPPPRREEA